MIVSAYGDRSWPDTEADDPVDEESRVPGAITSRKMCDEGDYVLALLAAGTYDLVVTGDNGADFGETLGFVSHVVVVGEPTPTIVDADTDDLEDSL